MSVLAHPGPYGLAPSTRRRRHLALVPASVPMPERDRPGEVVPLPARPVARPAAVAGSAAGSVAAIKDAPLRLTLRGRCVLAALAFVVAALIGAGAGAVVATVEGLPTDVESVSVSSGQTLWSIAAELTPPGSDVREVMSQIVALNGLESEALVPGQQLTVPTDD
jgi:LysM repeat protein